MPRLKVGQGQTSTSQVCQGLMPLDSEQLWAAWPQEYWQFVLNTDSGSHFSLPSMRGAEECEGHEGFNMSPTSTGPY